MNRIKYPWLTPAFLDRARYQVSRAMATNWTFDMNLKELSRLPTTRIVFTNPHRNIQLVHNGTVYNLDKLRKDPFKFSMIVERMNHANA